MSKLCALQKIQQKKITYFNERLSTIQISSIGEQLTNGQKILITQIIQYKENFNDKYNFSTFNKYCNFNKNYNKNIINKQTKIKQQIKHLHNKPANINYGCYEPNNKITTSQITLPTIKTNRSQSTINNNIFKPNIDFARNFLLNRIEEIKLLKNRQTNIISTIPNNEMTSYTPNTRIKFEEANNMPNLIPSKNIGQNIKIKKENE